MITFLFDFDICIETKIRVRQIPLYDTPKIKNEICIRLVEKHFLYYDNHKRSKIEFNTILAWISRHLRGIFNLKQVWKETKAILFLFGTKWSTFNETNRFYRLCSFQGSIKWPEKYISVKCIYNIHFLFNRIKINKQIQMYLYYAS